MKFRLLELLVCPTCKRNMHLYSFNEITEEINSYDNRIISPRCNIYCSLKKIFIENKNLEKEFNCSQCYQTEIVEGLLLCRCGSLYPIVDSIPRFIDNKLSYFPDFNKKYKRKIKVILNNYKKKNNTTNFSLSDDFSSICESFSEEWNFFDYDSDKTWGWDMEERKQVFLSDFGLDASSLKGKLLLDAGCGNGKLTAMISDFNMEVVGLDISDSVVRANENKVKYAKQHSCLVHFIQGSLFTPPLSEKSFDLIYCSGVLHHTPDTKETFLKIVPLVKKGGRVYIWVYGKRNFLVRLFMGHGRLLSRFVSLKSLFAYCRFISPFYKIVAETLSFLRIYGFRRRSKREISLDLFDCFSPRFNHTHRNNEVCGWFSEQNFIDINVSGIQKHGFGVYGDKAVNLNKNSIMTEKIC